MARASFHVTAQRLRTIAEIISDPTDQEIVRKYADDLDMLARCEVVSPGRNRLTAFPEAERLATLGCTLKKAFPLESGSKFGDLLAAFDL